MSRMGLVLLSSGCLLLAESAFGIGDSTPMAAGHAAANGYIALSEFDEGYGGNFDGQVTAKDARFGELCTCEVANRDFE